MLLTQVVLEKCVVGSFQFSLWSLLSALCSVGPCSQLCYCCCLGAEPGSVGSKVGSEVGSKQVPKQVPKWVPKWRAILSQKDSKAIYFFNQKLNVCNLYCM